MSSNCAGRLREIVRRSYQSGLPNSVSEENGSLCLLECVSVKSVLLANLML